MRGCISTGLILLAMALVAPARADRPNVLLIAIDDLNDWVGFLGGCPGEVFTPNLDRLARRGTAFTNAHCAAPVCCPSRFAVMSGLLPTSTGIYNNQHWWKPNLPGQRTIPTHFREHGYLTIGSGKIYHHTAGNNPPAQWDEFRRHPFRDNAWIRHGSPLYPWTGPMARPREFPYSGIKLYSEEADWGVLPIEESQYDDAVTANYAIEFLSKLGAKSPAGAKLSPPAPAPAQPFFLACGIFHPHMPWYVPQGYLDLYPLDRVVVPASPPDELADVPPPGRKLAQRKAGDLARLRKEGKWKSAIRHYLASISFADTQVGRVLDALAGSPAADNTLIVLWSDHGWHLGEKGHWHKRTLWEEATRVPLIVHAPGVGRPNQRCPQAVSLVDLFPTLTELCSLPSAGDLDGLSLVPLLKDPTRKREQPAIIVEESGHLAVRSERYRLIKYTSGELELYDHKNDPGEHDNLSSEAALHPVVTAHLKWLPTSRAKPAHTKKAFKFDPQAFTFTDKKTGTLIRGK